MLITECPQCHARFRASPEQLNQRQGQVRCGQCQGVFNAFESVVRPPAARAPFQTLMPPKQALALATTGAEIPLMETPASASDVQEAQDLADTALTADVQDATGTLEDVLPTRADQSGAAWRRLAPGESAGNATDLLAPAVRPRLSRAWSFGVVLLVAVLGMQLTYAFRAQLARSYPALRPALEAACAQAGCRVPWARDEAALRLEDSEMLEVPGKPGQIALQARIRNLAPYAQDYPHLELTLTDVTGQTAIRRVVRPAEYLGSNAPSPAVMAAGSEALLSLRLETGRIRATGYELLLFHP